MRKQLTPIVSALIATLVVSAAVSMPAGAAVHSTPLSVAQSAYRVARASHGKTSTSDALDQAAITANYNLAVWPDGYASDYDKTFAGDHGVALLVNAVHGGFGCVHMSTSTTIAPTSVLCPAPYLSVINPNPTRVSAKFLLATQVAGAVGLEASYVANAKTASAVSSAVPKILKIVSGVTGVRGAVGWTVTVRDIAVCLTFTSTGAYAVRSGACPSH